MLFAALHLCAVKERSLDEDFESTCVCTLRKVVCYLYFCMRNVVMLVQVRIVCGCARFY